MMRVTPRPLLGRVSAILNPLITTTAITGTLLGGIAYGALRGEFGVSVAGVRFGPLDTIYAGVAALCFIGGAYARVSLRVSAVEAEVTHRRDAPCP